MRKTYAACAALCDALQRPDVAKLVGETCEFDVDGAFLRMEYIQDVDGAWLEPHHDIPEKLFSMVIYLCLGPDAHAWGTDIYDSNRKLVGSASAEFDSCGDLHPGREHLARLRAAQDRRRAPADGDQLRPAELALARTARIPRPADQARLTARRAVGAAALAIWLRNRASVRRRAVERRAVNLAARLDLTGCWRLVGNVAPSRRVERGLT